VLAGTLRALRSGCRSATTLGVTTMLRYRPPKSSVWGHGLRRLPIARVHELVHRFLEVAAESYRFRTGNLWTSDASPEIVSRYEAAAERPALHDRIADLNPDECRRCFELLLTDEPDFRAKDIHLSLWQQYEVARWKSQVSEQITPSLLTVHYDVYPHLGTTLYFESKEQFHLVCSLLQASGLCALNPKHLKPARVQSTSQNDA